MEEEKLFDRIDLLLENYETPLNKTGIGQFNKLIANYLQSKDFKKTEYAHGTIISILTAIVCEYPCLYEEENGGIYR